ncbi:MAG: DUF1788 domain-containing protein [Bacteroides sp.]|nr:DUF1788 domain-containing protein [Bacteroides sp.]
MENIKERLDKVHELLKSTEFLEGQGLSNEVNIRLFCYDPADEMAVRHFVSQVLTDQALPCHLIEKNLYDVFLEICEMKRILNRIPDIEKNKGKKFVLGQMEKLANVDIFVDRICTEPFEPGDVLLLTGVGDVFPFMRIHSLLEAIQKKTSDVPILVMYPGSFDGRYVKLFDRLQPNPYYRAFNEV